MNIPDQNIVFGDWHRNAGHINSLEGIPAKQGSPHLTGDRNNWHRIHIGGGQPGDQIGRAGTGSGDADADPAGSAGITVRCMRRTLLMYCQDMTQRSVV